MLRVVLVNSGWVPLCFKFKTGKKTESLTQNERGATMVEYGVMVALIVVASVAVVQSLGAMINDKGFGKVLAASGDVE